MSLYGLAFLKVDLSTQGFVFLKNSVIEGFNYPSALYIPTALVWTVPLFLELYRFTENAITVRFSQCKTLTLKIKVLGIALLMINCGVWLYAFNPCISVYDSADLFLQAHQMRIVPMTNWHPPFYAIVLSFLLKIYDSISFLILVQCFFYSLLVVIILDYLIKKGISRRCATFLYLVLGFAFNNVIQLITLIKDVPYTISILWLTFLVFQYILDYKTIKKIWYIKFVLALIFTSFFRQNGIMPALAITITMAIFFIIKKKYKAIISIVAFLIAVFVINGPVYSYYNVVSAPGLKHFALANDLVGTYYLSPEDASEPLKKLVMEITDNDPDNFEFSSYYTHYNSSALGHYSIYDFMSLYITTWIEHPTIVSSEFLKRNTVLWSIIRPGPERVGSVNYLQEYHKDPPPKFDYPYRVYNKMTEILTSYAIKLSSNSLIYIFSWRTGVYSLFLLLFAFHIVKHRKGLMLIPIIPIFFNALSLYASSGWCDYRYFWPIAVIAVFLYPCIRLTVSEQVIIDE